MVSKPNRKKEGEEEEEREKNEMQIPAIHRRVPHNFECQFT